MANSKAKRPSALRAIGIIIVILGLVAGWLIFGPNTGHFTHGSYLYIHTGDDYAKVQEALEEGGFISNKTTFNFLAGRAHLSAHVHPGKYRITHGMSNFSLVKMLRGGHQEKVELVIKKIRTKRDFIHLISTSLEADSTQLKALLINADFLSGYGLDSNTAMCLVMQNTYEFYWNTGADKALTKIAEGYKTFWTDDNIAKAKALGLTPAEAVTLASIVDEETNNVAEKPTIASVYLNRLNQGMKLGADPTARFAYGDFTIKRITSVQTSVKSPYNTYQVTGLPIGPICTPGISSINAVLDAPKTAYLYFCAKADGSGTHAFATNYADHEKNAQAFHDAMNARGIH